MAAYSSLLQLTLGWTTSRPPESRSSVPSSRASSSGWRSGAITAAPTRRIRSVTLAIAENSMSEFGQGISGSWLPGAA